MLYHKLNHESPTYLGFAASLGGCSLTTAVFCGMMMDDITPYDDDTDYITYNRDLDKPTNQWGQEVWFIKIPMLMLS